MHSRDSRPGTFAGREEVEVQLKHGSGAAGPGAGLVAGMAAHSGSNPVCNGRTP